MRRTHLDTGAWRGDAMQFGEDGIGIPEMLEHVLEQDLVEARVLEWPRHVIEVVDDVGVGV